MRAEGSSPASFLPADGVAGTLVGRVWLPTCGVRALHRNLAARDLLRKI